MKVKEIAAVLEELAPLPIAEDFDNVGLLVGDPEMKVKGVLITLDALEPVVEEAIGKGCNLIVSFHPIIFSGLKRLTGKDYVQRAVMRAVENRIAIYSMHTALDNVPEGVSGKLCEVLGLRDCSVLMPKASTLKKLVTYVPQSGRDALLDALFRAGAGSLGNYSNCSFSNSGEGTFLPEAGAKPAVGTPGELHREPESQLHLTFPVERQASVLAALTAHHPYEEIAYELTTLENPYAHRGMGMVGDLKAPMEAAQFLDRVKERLHVPVVRHTEFTGNPIRRVAVLGGSGAFAIPAAKAAGAHLLLTADIKYHQFFQAEGQLVLADVGHFETEQFTKTLLHDYLTEKIPNFAISLSEVNTNPIKYY